MLQVSCLSVQRYNFLKANHNSFGIGNKTGYVVYRFKDTIFWKQITTWLLEWEVVSWLFIGSKIQFSESKSQQLSLIHVVELVVYRFKDTIFWKQITTIQCDELKSDSCLSVQRYNFLKANHNSISYKISDKFVVYRFKDTIFWKQITTLLVTKARFFSCLSVQRYNFLKANHNYLWVHK